MAIYHLRASIVGVELSSTGMHILRIAAGQNLTMPDTEQQSGLVEVLFYGRNIAVFIEDLMQRAEKINSQSA